MTDDRSMDRVPVDVLNFVRAETDTYMDDLAAEAPGAWRHHREPADVNNQTVIRLNRDTLYSSAVVDISQGAELVLPDAGARYCSAMVVNQDHYINAVFHHPGRYHLSMEDHGTEFVTVAVRTLVDPTDPADLTEVHALQDELRITSVANRPFTHPDWDPNTLKATRELLLELARGALGRGQAFGSRDKVEVIPHLLGTAAGWGGLPAEEARYQDVQPGLPVGHYTMTVADVPVDGFWSISVYNEAGYFEPNEWGRYSVNSVTAVRDAAGVTTINLGGDPSLPNQIPLPEKWSYVVRLYRPRHEILDGTWTFPELNKPS
jgi:hypothetical protein